MDESAPKLADNIISLDRAWLGPLGDYIWDGCVSSLGGLCCDLRKSQLHLFLFEAVALIFLLYSSIEVRFPQLSSWRTTHLCFGSVSHYFLLQIDFAQRGGCWTFSVRSVRWQSRALAEAIGLHASVRAQDQEHGLQLGGSCSE